MSKATEIRFIEAAFQQVQIDGGDVIVLSYPGVLPLEALARLQESLEKVFPGRECLILEEGATLGVAKFNEE